MNLHLTEQEQFHLQGVLTRVKEENEQELALADSPKWKARVINESEAINYILIKLQAK